LSGTLRFFSRALPLCAAAYITVGWFGAVAPILGPFALRSDGRLSTFEERTRDGDRSRRDWENSKTSQGDDDPKRNARRLQLLQAANAYALSPCDATIMKNLVEALTAYTLAWAEVAGCRDGAMNCTRLDEAQRAFGTPMDVRVRAAVDVAVTKGDIVRADFSPAVRNVVLRYKIYQSGDPCHARRGAGPRP